jgi:hypothetical protein
MRITENEVENWNRRLEKKKEWMLLPDRRKNQRPLSWRKMASHVNERVFGAGAGAGGYYNYIFILLFL